MITHLFVMAIALGVNNAADGEGESSSIPGIRENKLKTPVVEEEFPKILKRTTGAHGVLHIDVSKLKDTPVEEVTLPIIKRDKKEK